MYEYTWPSASNGVGEARSHKDIKQQDDGF